MSPALKVSLIALQQGCTLNSVHHHLKPHPGTVSQVPQNSDFPARICPKELKFSEPHLKLQKPNSCGTGRIPGSPPPPTSANACKAEGDKELTEEN